MGTDVPEAPFPKSGNGNVLLEQSLRRAAKAAPTQLPDMLSLLPSILGVRGRCPLKRQGRRERVRNGPGRPFLAREGNHAFYINGALTAQRGAFWGPRTRHLSI